MPLPSKRVKISFSLPKDLSYDFREQGDAVFLGVTLFLFAPPQCVRIVGPFDRESLSFDAHLPPPDN